MRKGTGDGGVGGRGREGEINLCNMCMYQLPTVNVLIMYHVLIKEENEYIHLKVQQKTRTFLRIFTESFII